MLFRLQCLGIRQIPRSPSGVTFAAHILRASRPHPSQAAFTKLPAGAAGGRTPSPARGAPDETATSAEGEENAQLILSKAHDACRLQVSDGAAGAAEEGGATDGR